MTAEGASQGFPSTRLRVGLWSLPPWLSRWALQVGRLYLSRRVEVPPLDVMVRNFRIEPSTVSALISLPNRYMHSPVEVVSLKDLAMIPELLAGFAASLKKGEQFKVKI